MTTRKDELETFKTDIDLCLYAVEELGFQIDRSASSRSSAALKHPNGDKIVVSMDGPKWVYFSVREHHSGTVIDLVTHYKRLNLGQVRKELRPWVGRTSPTGLPASSYVQPLEPRLHDKQAVLERFEAAERIEGAHPYLTQARGIPPALLASDRFAGRIRSDDRGAALFPHEDNDGLCGFEIKNTNFTGFAAGGTKGLWRSAAMPGDDTLVVAEVAIDALSYAVLHDHEGTRFVSIAGTMNRAQPGLLRDAIDEMPDGSTIVMALDNDEGGDKLAIAIREIFDELARPDLQLVDARPRHRGRDWNDELRARSPQPLVGGRPVAER